MCTNFEIPKADQLQALDKALREQVKGNQLELNVQDDDTTNDDEQKTPIKPQG